MSREPGARFQRGMSLETGPRLGDGRLTLGRHSRGVDHRLDGDRHERGAATHAGAGAPGGGRHAGIGVSAGRGWPGRYAWIEQVLRRFEYRRLGRADKGAVLAYLQHLSGYSRAQVARLVSRWVAAKPLVKNYRRPEHGFARRYTAADVALLPRWTGPWARCPGRPRPACCAASAMRSRTLVSRAWATSPWGICKTCATAQRTGRSAWC